VPTVTYTVCDHVSRGSSETRNVNDCSVKKASRVDVGLPAEVTADVTQRHAVMLALPIELPGLGQVILDLEQIGEVGVEEQRDLDVDPFEAMVGKLQMLAQAVGHFPSADQRHRGITIYCAGGLNQVEDGLVVLQGLRGEGVELAAVEPQLPAGQVSHVAIKEAVGVPDRTGHVAQAVADHKGRTLENAHLTIRHGSPFTL
jgi:hypothetical protein